jgi:hypothetical protein
MNVKKLTGGRARSRNFGMYVLPAIHLTISKMPRAPCRRAHFVSSYNCWSVPFLLCGFFPSIIEARVSEEI